MCFAPVFHSMECQSVAGFSSQLMRCQSMVNVKHISSVTSLLHDLWGKMLRTTESVRRGLERHWLEKLHERRCANLLLLVWVLWKNYSQRKTPYLQAQKSQWSSEHKELRSASAASESCLQRVLGWCRIFLGSSQRSDSEVETREAHRFCRWLPGAAKSSWSCHPPQKEYDPRLCDTAVQTGARWNGKRKQDSFIWAAGDKVAEGLANVSEGQLRRMGLLSTTARDKIEHHIVLCAHYLNKEPGLERVLRALAVHRQKRQMD